MVKFEWGLIVFFFKFCRFEHDLRGVNCVLLRSTVENRTRTWFYGTSSTSIVEHKRKFNRSGTENFNVAWWFGLGGGGTYRGHLMNEMIVVRYFDMLDAFDDGGGVC